MVTTSVCTLQQPCGFEQHATKCVYSIIFMMTSLPMVFMLQLDSLHGSDEPILSNYRNCQIARNVAVWPLVKTLYD